MAATSPPQTPRLRRLLKKLSVSGFVLFTFVAYAIHERVAGPAGTPSEAGLAPTALAPARSAPTEAPPTRAAPTKAPPTAAPATAAPTDAPPTAAPAQALGPYKDGTYVGTEIDAYYGLVQVQATIKQGTLADVQFLEYPNDRRTSIRINNIAMPYLQQEAIQLQSAQVDVISGATLTSEAFIESLQGALNSAKVKANA
mgnify:CR=1 FL=1